MVAHMFLPHLKRNARASMAMRKGFTFPSKAVSSRDTMQAPMVAINQPVLKSTTSFTDPTVCRTKFGQLAWSRIAFGVKAGVF